MTRLPKARDTHLTPTEVVDEALRQFDTGKEPSIRSLAGALHVTPSAIYHHFPSRGAIIDKVVERVWLEAMTELLVLVPEPLKADPAEVLVASGIATRRAWLNHAELSPYLAASPDQNEFTRNSLRLMANLFGRMGLHGERAGAAFHAYATFMIGSVLFAAGRRVADSRLARPGREDRFRADRDGAEERSGRALDNDPLADMMNISVLDLERDEELYEDALRRLVASLAQDSVSPERDSNS
ncbi:MAG TPA: TetR/AcrR family transcriptional regulator [Solirubrobacterales bacterium]|nr:TetR/AcrR family transcriptional regulator [Solirubrobacterales bacterium]